MFPHIDRHRTARSFICTIPRQQFQVSKSFRPSGRLRAIDLRAAVTARVT
jgi:hypothetical protein